MTTEFLTLTSADMEALLARLDGIRRQIEKLAKHDQAGSPKLLLSRSEAAKTLNISVSQLDALRRDGSLPAAYLDRHPRWAVADLHSFISSRRGTEPPHKRQQADEHQ